MNCPNCQKFGQQRPMSPIQICTECGTAYPSRSMSVAQFFTWHGHYDKRPTHPMLCPTTEAPGSSVHKQGTLRTVLTCGWCGKRVEMPARETAPAEATSGGQAA